MNTLMDHLLVDPLGSEGNLLPVLFRPSPPRHVEESQKTISNLHRTTPNNRVGGLNGCSTQEEGPRVGIIISMS